MVALVVDDEVTAYAQVLSLAAQDAGADGVEGADGQPREARADEGHQASSHLLGRLVGEGHGHDARGVNAAHPDEIGHPVGEDARLPRPRPGQHQHRPACSFHRLALGWIQALENVHPPQSSTGTIEYS